MDKDKQEIKRQLNRLYGQSSLGTSVTAKEFGYLTKYLLSRRYVDTDSVNQQILVDTEKQLWYIDYIGKEV